MTERGSQEKIVCVEGRICVTVIPPTSQLVNIWVKFFLSLIQINWFKMVFVRKKETKIDEYIINY